MGVLADRITTLEAGGVKVQLGQVAGKLEAAELADQSGDHELAARLRHEAVELITGNAAQTAQFSQTRQAPSGWRRTAELERQMHRWADEARTMSPTRASLEGVFADGSEANRAMALAMMTGAPSAASYTTAIDAITAPRSAFEQYHGLVVARLLASRNPTADETQRLREVVQVALQSGALGAPNSDRVTLAKRILELTPNE
ncbi:hypothetical protein [Cellulomonas terrae]|uniref:hypothetical protein n=1 Tax=Cellulomonas terrae TaxID=311234 RepID=UPI0011BDB7A9|nr:hypothetical protein [Cellulomonas terrae]